MRQDMAKILVERPRYGGCGKKNSRNNRHLTRRVCKDMTIDTDLETPNFRGMKRVHTPKLNSYEDKKKLNENLKPLRRFLDSCIGRPWDDVYSEIMSNLNLNNSVQYHVWQHLIQFGEVQTKTYMEGDTVMAAGVIGPQSMTDASYGQAEFYVDPRDGTLRKTKKIRASWRRPGEGYNETRYYDPKNPLIQYHKVAGIWYEFKFREATDEEKDYKSFGGFANFYDVSVRSWVYNKWKPLNYNKFVDQIHEDKVGKRFYLNGGLWGNCDMLFGGNYLPLSKRQISSKEIRKVESLMAERDRKISRRAA
jgi:hypothetical protein